MTDGEPFDSLPETVKQVERLEFAPKLIRMKSDEYGEEEMAELAAEIEKLVTETSIDRNIDKHGTIAAMYMVISALSATEEGDR